MSNDATLLLRYFIPVLHMMAGAVSIEKAKRLLGWSPSRTVNEIPDGLAPSLTSRTPSKDRCRAVCRRYSSS